MNILKTKKHLINQQKNSTKKTTLPSLLFSLRGTHATPCGMPTASHARVFLRLSVILSRPSTTMSIFVAHSFPFGTSLCYCALGGNVRRANSNRNAVLVPQMRFRNLDA
jgi:hypothetical protein